MSFAAPAAGLELSGLDGNNGYVVNGANAKELSGASVSAAGDVNNDGTDDFLIGAVWADPHGHGFRSGAVYVVFGSGDSFPDGFELSTLDEQGGAAGFVIHGEAPENYTGGSLGTADVNGDGISDILIGAASADPNGAASGVVYVVFGSDGFGAGTSMAATVLSSTVKLPATMRVSPSAGGAISTTMASMIS